MKRWIMVAIPVLLLGALLFVKPPAFTSHKSTPVPTSSAQPGSQPVIPSGGDDEGKPSYGGHDADEYGETPKK